MTKKTPKVLIYIILVGVAIVVIAIATSVIAGIVDENNRKAPFVKADGKLVVESNNTYDSKVVAYLEADRKGDSCAARTLGHDDAWIYTLAWCTQTHKDEGYISAYELQGRLGYKAADDKVTSSQFVGEGNIPPVKDLFPYDIYTASQNEIQKDIFKTLDAAARSREASLKR